VTDFLGLAAGIEAFFYNLGAGSALLEAYLWTAFGVGGS
jgi:hypothetical protein